MNRWLLRCAGYGLAFVIFLNTDQSNSEDVALRMPGLARQDVRVVYATERASPWLDDNIMRYVNNPVVVEAASAQCKLLLPWQSPHESPTPIHFPGSEISPSHFDGFAQTVERGPPVTRFLSPHTWRFPTKLSPPIREVIAAGVVPIPGMSLSDIDCLDLRLEVFVVPGSCVRGHNHRVERRQHSGTDTSL